MDDLKARILSATTGGLDYYLRHVPGLRPPVAGSRRCANARNPFYDDRKAGLSVWHEGELWLHKDHGEERYQGDVFAFAQHVHGLEAGRDFAALLKAMASELGLDGATADAFVASCPMTEKGAAFWRRYGIGPEWLVRYNITQVSHTLAKGEKRSVRDPTFAIGQDPGGVKLYEPRPGASRFWHLGQKPRNWIFGYKQRATKADLCLVTGSEKDLLAGLALADQLFPGKSVTGLALNSETASLEPALVAKLKARYGQVVLCFDADKTGERRAAQLASQHGLGRIELPATLKDYLDPLHNRPCKDLADYCALLTARTWAEPGSLLPYLVQAPKSVAPEAVQPCSDAAETDEGTVHETAPKRGLERAKARFAAFRAYLETRHVERNALTDQLLVDGLDMDLNTLYVQALEAGAALSFEDMKRFCFSSELPSFNPMRRYFEQLPAWDGQDHAHNLCYHLRTTPEHQERLYRQLGKWLARAVRQVFEPERFNKQMLVLVSASQNPGKTSLLRWLVPPTLKDHYTENPDPADKDARIATARSLIVSFDEVAVLERNRQAFKALLSSSVASVRLPYAAQARRLERMASFVATSNEYDFICDESGSVRYLCFELAGIDHGYARAVCLDQLWAQAYARYRAGEAIDMSQAELEENARANQAFTRQPEGIELVRRYYRPPRSEEVADTYLSASELKDVLAQAHPWVRALPEVYFGRALRAVFGPSKSQGSDAVKRYAMVRRARLQGQ